MGGGHVSIGHRDPCPNCGRVWWAWLEAAFVNGLGWTRICNRCCSAHDAPAPAVGLRRLARQWASLPETILSEIAG